MSNYFGGDSNCKALWSVDNGALTVDSIGTNTLTDINTVGTDTSDYKEGDASSTYLKARVEFLGITDGDLDSGFPLKSGDTNKKLSTCLWVKFDALETTGNALVAKWLEAGGERTYIIYAVESAGSWYLVMAIGYDGGASVEYTSTFGTAFTIGRWYHVGVTFQDSDKSYRLRVWDDTAGDFLDSDTTGTLTNNIYVGTGSMYLGTYNGGSLPHSGHIDEVVVFDDVLTPAEIDRIRRGIYGANKGFGEFGFGFQIN